MKRLVSPGRGRIMCAVAVAAALALSVIGQSTASAANSSSAILAKDHASWVGTWATTTSRVVPPPAASPFNGGFANQTIRQVVPATVGGDSVRLRLSNAYGDRAVTFEGVRVGLQQNGPTIVPKSNRPVTFGGHDTVTIQAGAVVVSDPVRLEVPDAANIVASYFTAEPTGAPTGGGFAGSGAVSYVAAGNRVNDVGGGGFTAAGGAWFLIAVDVQTSRSVKGAVVTIGDSITAGGRDAWPGVLASRLLNGPRGQKMPVLNVGIGGNRILSDSPCFNVSAVDRFDLDVLAQTGASTVVMLEGVNDLQFPNFSPSHPSFPCMKPLIERSAEELIEGVQQLAARAHARGMRFIGGTITPFKGAEAWSPQAEAARQAFNDWIRSTDAIDGYVDFAAAIADPTDSERMAAQYHRGDHLHPSLAGRRAMADVIDMKLLR